MELRDGDYVYRQGDAADHLFVILAGSVQKVVESADGSKVCCSLFVVARCSSQQTAPRCKPRQHGSSTSTAVALAHVAN